MEILKVSREEIRQYEKLKTISEMALVKEKLGLLERKYHCTFPEFEEKTRGKEKEDFEAWDDYIEWKAYDKTLQELEAKTKEIESAQDIRIT
ncbi:MAG: hypothetical protein COS87_03640 [Chloroflexi bacterium CG07_land_8_20_14_0_80_45_17]|nr:MAG: hypothetical protein COS87_03640 [Chloroflexi bacterium CG07_land_8_20_14_0_80_45_17]